MCVENGWWCSIKCSFSINFTFPIEIDISLGFLLCMRTITNKEFRIPFVNETAKSLLFYFIYFAKVQLAFVFFVGGPHVNGYDWFQYLSQCVCVCFVYAMSVYAFNEFNDAFNFRKTSAFESTLNRKFISSVYTVRCFKLYNLNARFRCGKRERKWTTATTTKANQFIFPHRDRNHNNHTFVWSESLLVWVSWVKKWVSLAWCLSSHINLSLFCVPLPTSSTVKNSSFLRRSTSSFGQNETCTAICLYIAKRIMVEYVHDNA